MGRSTQRFAALDGWRGICALLVALYHLNLVSALLDNGLVRHAWLFVDFFFVLSGFVITHTYWGRIADKTGAEDFTRRRFARIWPLHAAILLAFVGVEALKAMAAAGGVMSFPTPPFAAPNTVDAIVLNLAMLQTFGLTGETSWNYPSWSIAAEFWTYLVFAGLTWLAAGGPRWRLAATAFAAVLAALSLAVLVARSPHGMDATYDYGFVRCLYGFFAGHFTYRLWRMAQAKIPPPPAAGAELAAIACAGLFVTTLGETPWAFLAPLVFSATVFVFAFEGGAASRLMASRPLHWLGERSYTIYMVHAFIAANLIMRPIQVLEKLTGQSWTIAAATPNAPRMIDAGSEPAALALIVLYIGLVLAFAAAAYRWIEMPAQRWLLRRRRRAAPAAAPVDGVAAKGAGLMPRG